MPLQYDPKKIPYATEQDPESLTEIEWQDSCDINLMMKSLHRGQSVSMNEYGNYGYDDTTMDSVRFRIEKETLERELNKTSQEHEFSEEELKAIPDEVKKKFKFKKKAPTAPINNDDLTTMKNGAQKPPQNEKELQNDRKTNETP